MPHSDNLRLGIGPSRANSWLGLAAPGPESPRGTSDSLPVYRADQTDFRRPFCLLRLPPDQNLFNASRRFHQQELASPDGSRALEFRELLGRFIDLCEGASRTERLGLDYSEAVFDQVVVGSRGEVVYVDRPDEAAAGASLPQGMSFKGKLQPASIGGALQAVAGRDGMALHAETGAQRNVYNLGVALYYLLSGGWPLGGRRAPRAFADRHVEMLRPCELHKDVPASLKAICVKSMSPQPSERFASAQELAQAVRAWRDGEGLQVFYELLRAASHGKRNLS